MHNDTHTHTNTYTYTQTHAHVCTQMRAQIRTLTHAQAHQLRQYT